jgi:hypothetical protein
MSGSRLINTLLSAGWGDAHRKTRKPFRTVSIALFNTLITMQFMSLHSYSRVGLHLVNADHVHALIDYQPLH